MSHKNKKMLINYSFGRNIQINILYYIIEDNLWTWQGKIKFHRSFFILSIVLYE